MSNGTDGPSGPIADAPDVPGEANWQPIETAPVRVWLRTKLEGEAGENVCAKVVYPDGDVEWVERGPYGRTTVTHHSFAAPTHWARLP